MTIIFVPVTPGNHRPDDETRQAMAIMVASAHYVATTHVPTQDDGSRARCSFSWDLPGGKRLLRRRLDHRVQSGNRLDLIVFDKDGNALASCTVEGHQMTAPEDDLAIRADCLAMSRLAQAAITSIPTGERGHIVQCISEASLELIRQSVADTAQQDQSGVTHDLHWTPATPWSDASRFTTTECCFPMVVGVAVTAPVSIDSRIAVRLSPYQIEHADIEFPGNPVTRLRGAAALAALNQTAGSRE